jgi:DNA modification methylase
MQIRDRVKTLRRVRAKDLKPNPKNWRTHPEAQRNALRGVLAEIGYADALIARELKDGTLELIDGHLRAETTPDAKVPVLVLDVTEKEADLLLATLDPLSAMAESNPALLDELLSKIAPRGEAVQELLDSIADAHPVPGSAEPTVADPGPLVDYQDELKRKWKTARGQVWTIPSKAVDGEHRLICGDSTNRADVDRAAAGRLLDLVVTSPPYNVGIDFDGYKDSKPRDEYFKFLRAILDQANRVLAGGRFIAWNIGVSPRTYPHHHLVLLEQAGFEFHRQVIWQKVGLSYPVFPATMRVKRARHYTPNYTHDLIQVGRKPGADGEAVACPMCTGGGKVPSIDLNCAEGHEVLQLFTKGPAELGGRTVPLDRYANDVWKISQSQATRDLPKLAVKKGLGRHRVTVHPAPYPPELVRAVMCFLSAPGERVFDPFCGTGTTIVAAEQMQRLGVGIELSDRYVACALERFSQMGLKPKLAKK